MLTTASNFTCMHTYIRVFVYLTNENKRRKHYQVGKLGCSDNYSTFHLSQISNSGDGLRFKQKHTTERHTVDSTYEESLKSSMEYCVLVHLNVKIAKISHSMYANGSIQIAKTRMLYAMAMPSIARRI